MALVAAMVVAVAKMGPVASVAELALVFAVDEMALVSSYLTRDVPPQMRHVKR